MLQAHVEGIIFRRYFSDQHFALEDMPYIQKLGNQAEDVLESHTVVLICIILSTTFQNIHQERLKVMLYNKEVTIQKCY